MKPTHGWCPNCHEESAQDYEGRCLWCETPTRPKSKAGKPRGVYGKLSDTQLRSLHAFHLRGVSIRELGRRIYEKAGFATPKSAAMGISSGFKRLALPAQDRAEATAASNRLRRAPDSPGTSDRAAHKRWMREKAGGYWICKGTKQGYPRKGSPCTRFAMNRSEFCIAHDPARREANLAVLVKARAASEKSDISPTTDEEGGNRGE